MNPLFNFHTIYKYYCKECNINKAKYNYKNVFPEEFCSKCKKEGMVDKRRFICIDKECTRNAVYLDENTKKLSYCIKHKKGNTKVENEEENYRFVKSYNCGKENCLRKSLYNYEGKKIPEWCFKHKEESMIPYYFNICLDCDQISKYDYISKSLVGPNFCFLHKHEYMENLYNEHCNFENCINIGIYGYDKENTKLYCTEHYKREMKVQKKNICKTIFCEKKVNNCYKGYCAYCFVNTFPEEAKNTKMRNCREIYIIQCIMKSIPGKNFIFNKKINNARPDIILKLENQILIIEIDENQHKNYSNECETQRINELYCDLDYKNIVLIRFNPDTYIDSFKKKKESCFISNNEGKYILNSKQKKEYEIRINKLCDTINYYIKNQISEPLKIINLFFDNYCDNEDLHKDIQIINE